MSATNGNPTPEDEYFDTDSDDKQLAVQLVDQTLTAIGGLETDDPMDAVETVVQMYVRMLGAIRDEE